MKYFFFYLMLIIHFNVFSQTRKPPCFQPVFDKAEEDFKGGKYEDAKVKFKKVQGCSDATSLQKSLCDKRIEDCEAKIAQADKAKKNHMENGLVIGGLTGGVVVSTIGYFSSQKTKNDWDNYIKNYPNDYKGSYDKLNSSYRNRQVVFIGGGVICAAVGVWYGVKKLKKQNFKNNYPSINKKTSTSFSLTSHNSSIGVTMTF
jgi:hypothetical protein